LGAAKKTYADGRNAHLIQQPAQWWVKNLKKFFDVHEPIQKGNELHAIVTPKSEHGDPILAVKLGDIKARFYIPNDTCKWRAETLLAKEPVTIDWISRMKKGETLFDIGANVGGYTVWAGVQGINTYSFEPEAENYALLVRNLRLNNLDGKAFCVALSDKTGLDELHLSQPSAGGSCHTFGESKDFNLKDRPDVVRQGCLGMRLDDLNLKPDHIKLDVDGLEHKVIEGAIETLKTVKTVLIEINPNIHSALIAKMVELGFLYDEDQVEASKRKSGPFKGVAEYVFYRTDILRKIREAEVIEEPFPHLAIPDFLDTEIDAEAEYTSLEEARGTKGYPERFVAKAPQIGLKNVWVRAALTDKFGVDGNIDETLLIRDKAGYKIGPHTDSPKRSLSMIVYLDDGEGTSLYTPNDPKFKCMKGTHYPFDNFTRAKTVSGKNTAFVFAKSDISFHGVEPTTKDRQVLLYDVRHS
jgi:FkbM family methyltransferase